MKYRYLMIGLLLSGCMTANEPSGPRLTDAEAFMLAKQNLIASLKDPDSAKLEPVMHRKAAFGEDVVCGRVNAKNSYGGYSGMSTFVYRITPSTAGTLATGDGSSIIIDTATLPYAARNWCS